MKKMLLSFALVTGLSYSAEIHPSPAVHVIDMAVLQPMATYFEVQAVIDLQKGADFVEQEANKILVKLLTNGPEIESNVKYYIDEQLKKDIDNLKERAHKNLKNEGQKAVVKVDNYVTNQAPKDIEKHSKRGKKNLKNESKKAEKKAKKHLKKWGVK